MITRRTALAATLVAIGLESIACSTKDSSPVGTGDGWGMATLIGPATYACSALHLEGSVNARTTVDSDGNVTVAWCQYDNTIGVDANVYANRYAVGTGWGTPGLIETENAEESGAPQVVVDGSGNVTALWTQFDAVSVRPPVWTNRYVNGMGWGTAIRSPLSIGAAVAMDRSGSMTAVWNQTDEVLNDSRLHVWANRHVGTEWETPTLLEADNPGNAIGPRLAVDAGGNATVVWEQWDGMASISIWANRYAVATGWETAARIEMYSAGGPPAPQVAVDGSGNATAVWVRRDSTQRANLWASRYAVGSGWGTPALIETDDAEDAGAPQVAVDENNNATVVWEQAGADTIRSIWANRYVVGSGWGAPTLLETDDGDAREVQLAVDGAGNTTVVWRQYDDVKASIYVHAIRYVSGTGWGTATRIEMDSLGYSMNPHVAVNGSGTTSVVWARAEGIWANRRQRENGVQ